MARRSLKPQLNQIRTWVRQGRTDAWIAHQLEVSVKDISAFKQEHDLEPGESSGGESDIFGPRLDEDEPDLRAEDEARVAAALEAEQEEPEEDEELEEADGEDDAGASTGREAADGDGEDRPRRRRRGRRGGRGRARGARKALEGSFDHGEDGYGLWLDPAVQDDPVYAEHWAGHRPIEVAIESDRIVITRAGESSSGDE